MKYVLKQDVWFSGSDPLHGPMEGHWKAGTIRPKSEPEEEIMRRLVEGGFAEEVPEKATAGEEK
jgi:hypothetical protein